MGTKHGDSCQHPLWTRGVSNGAQPDAMSGGIRAVATIQSADKGDQEHVVGLTISQVSQSLHSFELTIFVQGRLARSPAACPTATGVVKCRRFPSTALPS